MGTVLLFENPGENPGGPHPAEGQLERFLRMELPRHEVRAVVRHLLTDCPRCAAVTRRCWQRRERAPGLEAALRQMAARRVRAHDEPGLI